MGSNGPRDRDTAALAASLARPERFAEIFERHYDTIHRYLSRRVGAGRADDLAAAAFVTAFERRATFRPEAGSVLPWLYGIATNGLRNDRRAVARELELLARVGLDQPRVTSDETEYMGALGVALAALDHDQRDALLLHAWEGLSYEEVARAQGVPLGTVRSRLSRARTRLRAALEPEATNQRSDR